MIPCKISLRILYACLALALVCLIMRPAVLALETKSASCGGGRSVSCNAYQCVCQDNYGCTGYNAQGQVTQDYPCPAGRVVEQGPVY